MFTMNHEKLSRDIAQFAQVAPITEKMHRSLEGISRMVMLDRYAFKDIEKVTLGAGDLVVLTVKDDPKYPTKGTGIVQSIDRTTSSATIYVDEEFRHVLEDHEASGLVTRSFSVIEKPLEIYYEQIATRNAKALASVEEPAQFEESFQRFYQILSEQEFIPAGRVLNGAGSGSEVTFFNCYVMPFIQDSRDGLSQHRKEVMEIMSRGGGVGTNGSTLRPRHTLAKGVNGKSSGAVSWMDDIAKLTHLVEQGGSRRGAQMLMMADWHPDVIEFIISKIQKPDVLRLLIQEFDDEGIVEQAKRKLEFTPLTALETNLYESVLSSPVATHETKQMAKKRLKDEGVYSVYNPDFLTGANISVTISSELMRAVEENSDFALRFPDTESYDKEEMKVYNETWSEVGDVREWEALGHKVRTYRTIPAKTLWDLIHFCATYSAEPGIFFIDNANDKTNAKAYGQKVVATNPCGEQPLAPYSVCNLAAINLATFADKEKKVVDKERLRKVVRDGVRLQDNVISATPYFLEKNRIQALGERRIGLGVMGLADLLIYCEKRYGSKEGNQLVDEVFELIATTAYRASIELAKEKGSFPFLVGKTDTETQSLREAFVQSGFMQNMPQDIREDILRYGIRNSHLLTVAPTGSTGTMVGVATGLEPYFSFKYYRSGRLGNFIEVNADIVQEYTNAHGLNEGEPLPNWFVSSMQLKPEEHVAVQCIIQRWVDSSISKTVNAPKGYRVDQVQEVYESLYKGGAKGGTVYVDGSREGQVLNLLDDVEEETDSTAPEEKENAIIYGNELGDTCPVCRSGEVRDIGGCATCDSCGMQLKCGL